MLAFRCLVVATSAMTFSLCAPQVWSAEPPQTKVRVTTISPDGSTNDVTRVLKVGQLAGTYYQGDGLGVNLELTLKADGKFECKWRGCLGTYGANSGEWAIRDLELKFSPKVSQGMFKDLPLDPLRVVSFQRHYLLVQKRDWDRFKSDGPNTFVCFHQSDARNDIEKEYYRRIEESVKAVEKRLSKPK